MKYIIIFYEKGNVNPQSFIYDDRDETMKAADDLLKIKKVTSVYVYKAELIDKEEK